MDELANEYEQQVLHQFIKEEQDLKSPPNLFLRALGNDTCEVGQLQSDVECD